MSTSRRIPEPGHSELLVFGYSCKLFRDDDKALYIDQGKHLIPWMGDETLKIDRYDARGTLYDLRPVEAPKSGFDNFASLSEAEKRIEALCDEERYLSLHTDDDELQESGENDVNYVEERYKQVEYNYSSPNDEVTTAPYKEPDDEPFTPSPMLDIPLNMPLPESTKQNTIIEKTASFICSQGLQMEILIKTKQAGNPMFGFLSRENPLHNYYRLIVQNMKTGRYKPQYQEPSSEEDSDDNYLHPSLAPSTMKIEVTPYVPPPKYKPSENCAYSMLVQKLRGKTQQTVEQGQTVDERLSQASEHSNSMNTRPTLPPHNVRLIIDKMAMYVAKNGRDFETIVKSNNDSRFDFLEPGHTYYDYYLSKLTEFTNINTKNETVSTTQSKDNSALLVNSNATIEDADNRSKDSMENDEQQTDAMQDKRLKCGKNDNHLSKIAPVCFSIKTKEADPKIEKTVFYESSSDDDDSVDGQNDSKPKDQKTKIDEVQRVVRIDTVKAVRKETKQPQWLERTIVSKKTVRDPQNEKRRQLERKKRVAEFLSALKQKNQLKPIERTNDDNGDSDVESLPDGDDDFLNSPKRSKFSSEDPLDREQNSDDPCSITIEIKNSRASRKEKKRKHHRKHSSSKKHKRHRRRSISSED